MKRAPGPSYARNSKLNTLTSTSKSSLLSNNLRQLRGITETSCHWIFCPKIRIAARAMVHRGGVGHLVRRCGPKAALTVVSSPLYPKPKKIKREKKHFNLAKQSRSNIEFLKINKK